MARMALSLKMFLNNHIEFHVVTLALFTDVFFQLLLILFFIFYIFILFLACYYYLNLAQQFKACPKCLDKQKQESDTDKTGNKQENL